VTAVERAVTPEILKKKATSGAKFAFEQGEKVGENLKSAEGLLTQRAMSRGKYDPMGLLGLGIGGSSATGQDYDQKKKRKRQGAR